MRINGREKQKDGGEANRVRETEEEQKEELAGDTRTLKTKDA